MLGRRNFLKLLGLGAGGLAVGTLPALPKPQPELVVPTRRLYQLDQTMLGQPLEQVVARAQQLGTVSINGVVVATVSEWSWSREVEPLLGYSRHVSRLQAQVNYLDKTLEYYNTQQPVDITIRERNREITLKDMHIDQLWHELNGFGFGGRLSATGVWYKGGGHGQ